MNILVVDDELFICELLEEFISKLGYEVTTASSGEDALSKFRQEKFEVVLLDIKMPGMNGREVLRRIKEMDRSTGVIVLSAFGDGVTVNDMLGIGADDFLVKPFELNNLEILLSRRQKIFAEKN